MDRLKVKFQQFIKLMMMLGSDERKILKIIVDSIIIVGSLTLAFLFRFEWIIPKEYQIQLLASLPVLWMISLVLFNILGVYSDFWVYLSFRDMKRLILVHSSAVLSMYLIVHFFRILPIPRSILPIYWFVSTTILASMRILWRNAVLYRHENSDDIQRIIIIGAGQAGEMLISQIQSMPDRSYKVLCLLDDDPARHNRCLHGVRILGDVTILKKAALKLKAHEIIIAIPSATSPKMRRIVELCENTGLPFRTVPGPKELLDGRVTFNRIRPVQIDDLLGREQGSMDITRVSRLIRGKTVLVTGAAGSIGSELCRQIQKMSPQRIIILDKDENRMFYLFNELKPHGNVEPFVMNIANRVKLDRIFRLFQPSLVFHAAAYKHVPCMEWSPEEAIINNLESTIILSETAAEANVEKFIQISTDKAVHPTTIMGASKRLCELYICQYIKRGIKGFVSVRFGNVIGSQGSVFTIFNQQIKDGLPLTVTHPQMERYFMSIEEACKLVLEAGALGTGGCIFGLDMGEPIKIMDLAKQMIYLSGLKPDEDIPIEVSGLRPGEKLREKIWYDHEKPERTLNPKIFASRINGTLNNHFLLNIHDILIYAKRMQYTMMNTAIQQLIPDYQPSHSSSLYQYDKITSNLDLQLSAFHT